MVEKQMKRKENIKTFAEYLKLEFKNKLLSEMNSLKKLSSFHSLFFVN